MERGLVPFRTSPPKPPATFPLDFFHQDSHQPAQFQGEQGPHLSVGGRARGMGGFCCHHLRKIHNIQSKCGLGVGGAASSPLSEGGVSGLQKAGRRLGVRRQRRTGSWKGILAEKQQVLKEPLSVLAWGDVRTLTFS